MNQDILISFAFFGGLFGLGFLLGFIVGRITCSCRKAQRKIDRYRQETGADKPNLHVWDPLEIPEKKKDDTTLPIKPKTCWNCAHYTEEGEDNTGWCLAMKCRTSLITKVVSAPCIATGRNLFEERPDA